MTILCTKMTDFREIKILGDGFCFLRCIVEFFRIKFNAFDFTLVSVKAKFIEFFKNLHTTNKLYTTVFSEYSKSEFLIHLETYFKFGIYNCNIVDYLVSLTPHVFKVHLTIVDVDRNVTHCLCPRDCSERYPELTVLYKRMHYSLLLNNR